MSSYRALKIWEDPESVTALRILRRTMLEQRVSLMAVIDDEDDVHSKSELVGVLLIAVKSKNDPPTKVRCQEAKKYLVPDFTFQMIVFCLCLYETKIHPCIIRKRLEVAIIIE